ncbi:MAG: acetyl-CoA carboxylase biotin carboxyl carrier protein subunit, partial [Tidjanibacter sp.]|nr:acetyl-CoA carboxylase biotin carboxyl carrier protein subunit [Tidjanibacter sp.]
KYKMQPNPVLEDCGGVKLAENEKEELLLELFPLVAKDYLTKTKRERWEANKPKEEPKPEPAPEPTPAAEPIVLKGAAVVSPLPGTVMSLSVKEGDEVKRGQEVLVLDAMKMENSVVSDHKGKVLRIFVEPGQAVPADGLLMEIGE